MEKEYLVVGSGKSSKNTGKPYCIAKLIVKLDGKQFISDKDTQFVEEFIPVGETLTVSSEVTY